MRTHTRHIVWTLLTVVLLVGGAVLCAVRWRAWFYNPAEPEWTGDTITLRLHTFAEDSVPGFVLRHDGWQDIASPEELRILLLGDVHNGVTHEQWLSMAAAQPELDAYAQLGDFLERGYFYYMQQLLRELDSTRFAELPLICCPGNHEYHKGLIKRLPQLWYDHFPQPHNGPQDFLGTTYYVDFPNLRFIVLDSNGLQQLRDFTRVHCWLHNAMDTAGERFVVVMMHHPVFSTAKGRQNVAVNIFFRFLLQQADLVFYGHDHNYARRLPYIETSAARKSHRLRPGLEAECTAVDVQLYEVITCNEDSLTLSTYVMDSDSLYDHVVIRHDDVLKPVRL